MSRKQPTPAEVAWRVLTELQACQGVYWREVQVQCQGHYQSGTSHDETAFRILLADADDLGRAHRRFRDVVSPHFYLAHFSVSYFVMSPDGPDLLCFLADNDAIEDAGDPRHPLGGKPRPMPSGSAFGA